MDIQKTLKSIALAGIGNSLRAVLYSRQRDALEKRYAPPPLPETFTAPGACVAVEGARFKFEHAELEVEFLTDDMVRLTWTPGTLPAPYAIARSEWSGATVQVVDDEQAYELWSRALIVRVWRDGRVEFVRADSEIFIHQAFPPEQRGPQWRQRARRFNNEYFYGLGERAAPLNLSGHRYQLWNQDPAGIYTTGQDPLYLSMPVYMGRHTGGTYLIFHENTHPGWFDALGDEQTEMGFEGGALRYYFCIGTPAQLVERFTALTGRAPLPPRWALGYHHCVVAYKTEAAVQAAADGMQQHDLPISVLHMDLDYMDGYRTFTIDAKRFPNLKAISQTLLQRGVRLVTIIDTAVKVDPNYKVYREGLAAGAFCKLPSGEVMQAPVWPGWAVFPDFTDPQARAWWGQYYPHFLDNGISGFWHDMNEPAIFSAWGDPTAPRPTRHALDGQGGDHSEAHNVYALNMNRAGYEALRRLRPQQRPWLLTRAGFVGIQRYAWSWTGDTACEWSALRQTVPTVLGLGLSGLPYTGPDTGGFNGHPSPEMYTRWFQLSAFLPFFRTMAAFTTPGREPWLFGESALSIARAMLRLRYELMPYWYTLAWHAAQTGHPLVRPLFWADDSDPALWAVDDAFLLGDAILVAPVLEDGQRARAVQLPAGDWYDWWDEKQYTGPSVINLSAPLEHIPFLVRAGTVLPTEDAGTLRLHVYAPLGDGEDESVLYNDAGDGYNETLFSRFYLKRAGTQLTLTWTRNGGYTLPYTAIEIRLHGANVAHAWADDVAIEWKDGAKLTAPFARVRWQLV